MASTLLDKIKQSKQGQVIKDQAGVLQETSPESVQQLAGQAGLVAPPIDPLSTATIGGNQHQQKMAGSPAQVGAALRIAQDRNQSLSDATRREQPRAKATAQEQALLEKSKEMQELGQLGDRVNDLVNVQRQKLATATPPAAAPQQQVATELPQSLSGLPTDPTALGNLKVAAAQLLSNPQDANAMLALNQALGRDANSILTPQEISQLYTSSTDAIAKSGADTVDDSLTVTDLLATGGLPYQIDQLSELLGVPPEQLSTYSVGQLKTAIDSVAEQEFNQTAALEQQAGSGLIGGAERGLAREQAREASRTGLRSSEQDINNLERQIADAEQVSFGGQSYNVDDLLKDDTISGIISDYLNSSPDSDLRKQLEETEPALIDFINKNQAVLDDAAKQMAAGADQFKQQNQQNQQIAKVGNVTLEPALLKAMFPDFGELRTDSYDINSQPFYTALNKLSPKEQEQFANAANVLASDPVTADLARELVGLSEQEIDKLGLNLGPGKSPYLNELIANRRKQQEIDNTSPQDITGIISQFTGGQYTDPKALQDAIEQNKLAKTLGLDFGSVRDFDRDLDGKLDPPEVLLARMQARNKGGSLKDVLAGNTKTFSPASIDPFSPDSREQQVVFNKLGPLAKDGKLDWKEVYQADMPISDFLAIEQAGLADKLPGRAGEAIKDRLATYRATVRNKILDNTPVLNLTKYGHDVDGLLSAAGKMEEDVANIENRIKEFRANNPYKVDIGPLLDRRDSLLSAIDLARTKASDAQESQAAHAQDIAAAKERREKPKSVKELFGRKKKTEYTEEDYKKLAERSKQRAMDKLK